LIETVRLPREKDVEVALRKHLKEHGYTVKEKAGIHGVDIVASKNGKNYYVEVEGNTNRRGNPMTTSQKYTHLLRAVGQICLRMNDEPDGTHELVLAEDEYYRKKATELQISLKKLGVETYFLDSNGNVTH
jgi:hypothetical protein